MKLNIAKFVILFATFSSLGATADQAGMITGSQSLTSMATLIQQGGLVVALVIAVWYTAKLAERKDDLLYGALTTVLKANTEALVAQKVQSEDLAKLMVEVKDRLGNG